MKIVFGDDSRVQRFVNGIKSLNSFAAEVAFGQSYVANLTCIPIAPENRVFVLRKSKPREFDLSLSDSPERYFSNNAEAEAYRALREAAKDTFPVLISDCRIYRVNEMEGFLRDRLGQQTPPVPLVDLKFRSKTSMVRRCLKFGVCGWFGPKEALGPYFDFCIAS